jgi:hypothetical protein
MTTSLVPTIGATRSERGLVRVAVGGSSSAEPTADLGHRVEGDAGGDASVE